VLDTDYGEIVLSPTGRPRMLCRLRVNGEWIEFELKAGMAMAAVSGHGPRFVSRIRLAGNWSAVEPV
jgi:hypothetical protein